MQQTVPKDPQDPLERPPELAQALDEAQMPASAFGETHVDPSNHDKPDASVENRVPKLLPKFGRGFLNDGTNRLSVLTPVPAGKRKRYS